MYYLKKDGETIFKHPVGSIVYEKLLEIQPQSTDHAITCEGYSIEEEETEHEKKYKDLAKKAGIEVKPSDFGVKDREELIQKAREDEHLNNIPLKRFDMSAYAYMAFNPETVKKYRLSLGDLVCIYKYKLKELLNS
ncbi:MAG: hypothetical protein ACOCQR_03930 [bacterium]